MHVEPVLDQMPVVVSLSDVEVAVATESCTVAPIAADPVKVSVRFVVTLSVVMPLSDEDARSGVDTAGSAYRTTTNPDPPAPPVADELGLSQ